MSVYGKGLIFFILIFFFSNILLNYFLIKRKQFHIKSNNIRINRKIPYNNYLNKIDTKLKKLGYPFKLNTKKFLIIKILIPLIFSFITIYTYSNIIISIIYFILLFFLIDIILYYYSKNENLLITNDLYIISEKLSLALASNIPFFIALKNATDNINYKRLKDEFKKFQVDYEMYSFDLKKSSSKLLLNFNSYELKSFIEILIQSDKEGNLVQNLNGFINTLELIKVKYQKITNAKKFFYVTMGSLLILGNLIAVIAYPLLLELITGINKIFI